jgi:hypothetical protein
MVDTAAINRYSKVDSTQHSRVEVPYPAMNPSVLYTVIFRKDSGIVRLSVHNAVTMEGFQEASHELLRATVTEVNYPRHGYAPTQCVLNQNYPNPFNPLTTIEYELQHISNVNLSVYDVLGRKVCVLVNEKRDAGVHEIEFDGSGLSSGVYLYRLMAGNFVQTRTFVLLK